MRTLGRLILGPAVVLAAAMADAPADACERASACAREGPAPLQGWRGTYSLQVENDYFGTPDDGHYTNGVGAAWVSEPHRLPGWWCKLSCALPWLASAGTARTAITLGQNIFTPEDITVADLIPQDRPYGGWLYVGLGLIIEQDEMVLDTWELTVGVVGPESFAEDVQVTWHEFIKTNRPVGWSHQLHNEPGIVLSHEKKLRQWWRPDTGTGLEFDLTPHGGFSLGNVFTHAAGGVTARIGIGLQSDYGAPRIRPSVPGSGFFDQDGRDWSAYVFLGTEARIVARNIFLDGNSFTDSHSVDRKHFVGDLQGGLVVSYGRLRLSYTQIYRTQEFDGQDDPDKFGAISVSFKF